MKMKLVQRMSFWGIALMAAASSLTAHAERMQTLDEVREHADKVMSSIGKGDVQQGFDIIMPYLTGELGPWKGGSLQWTDAMQKWIKQDGALRGMEFVRTDTVGTSLVRHVYLIKSPVTYMGWQLDYYTGADGWGVIGVNMGDKVDLFGGRKR